MYHCSSRVWYQIYVPPLEGLVLTFRYHHPSRGWYRNFSTTSPRKVGNKNYLLPSLKRLVLKFMYHRPHKVGIWFACHSRDPSTILSEPYLIEPSQMLRACDRERKGSVYWPFPYRINRAFTSCAPYLEASHPPLLVPRPRPIKRAHCLTQWAC